MNSIKPGSSGHRNLGLSECPQLLARGNPGHQERDSGTGEECCLAPRQKRS